MATMLEQFPVNQRRAANGAYTRFLDGRVWSLKAGEDFHVSVASLRAALINQARRTHGGTVKVRTTMTDYTPGAEVVAVQLVKE